MSAANVAIWTTAGSPLDGPSAGAPLKSKQIETADTAENERKQRMSNPFQSFHRLESCSSLVIASLKISSLGSTNDRSTSITL
jgi:hypothetical protein